MARGHHGVLHREPSDRLACGSSQAAVGATDGASESRGYRNFPFLVTAQKESRKAEVKN